MSELAELYDSDSSQADSLFSQASSIERAEKWRASEEPPEIFGDGEWAFSIIGEEIDFKGEVLYEVRWEDWHREDGTNTTWETQRTIDSGKWRTALHKLRRDMANETLGIEPTTTTDIHNTATYLRSQAFEEKLSRSKRERPPDPFTEMENLLSKRPGHAAEQPSRPPTLLQVTQGTEGSSSSHLPSRMNQRTTTRQQTENSIASSSTLTRSSSRLSNRSSIASSPANIEPTRPTTPSVSSSSSKTFVASIPPTTTVPQKRKQVASTPEILRYAPHSRAPSNSSSLNPSHISSISKGKGKRRASFSEEDELASTSSLPSTKPASSSSTRPVVLKKQLAHPLPRIGPPTGSRQPSAAVETSVVHSRKQVAHPLPRIGPPTGSRQPLPVIETSAVRRKKLQQKWTSYATAAHAAAIYFVNDVDDEAIPDLGPSFRYLEAKYEFSPGIQKPDDNFLVSCSCEYCFDPKQCDCQAPSDLVDAHGSRLFAYRSPGLFTFASAATTEVVECNKNCKCTVYQCANRVSQRPRDTPIEIFKTETRGWGVRSTVELKRGKVLGIYTGLVIHRAAAEAFPPELSQYRFDLDGDESEGKELTHERFSVDSRLQGNWTRFINHSCSPNLQIYLVVNDTPPGCGLPYIAFVVTQDIPARAEFTFDYDPKEAQRLALLQEIEISNAHSKKKGKQKASGSKLSAMAIPEGGQPCHCGSDQCRGYMTSSK